MSSIPASRLLLASDRSRARFRRRGLSATSSTLDQAQVGEPCHDRARRDAVPGGVGVPDVEEERVAARGARGAKGRQQIDGRPAARA